MSRCQVSSAIGLANIVSFAGDLGLLSSPSCCCSLCRPTLVDLLIGASLLLSGAMASIFIQISTNYQARTKRLDVFIVSDRFSFNFRSDFLIIFWFLFVCFSFLGLSFWGFLYFPPALNVS